MPQREYKHGKRAIPFSTYELPFNAINYCLQEADIKLVDVDHTYALAVPTAKNGDGGSPLLNSPLQNGPFRVLAHEVPCRPCGYQTCPIGYVCLDGVKVEHAVEVASAIMRTQ